MEFSRGVYAYLTFNGEAVHYWLDSGESVYDYLEPVVGHDEAEEAACWCELHCVGDEYEHELFTIEMVED